MKNKEMNQAEYYTIDLRHVAKTMWHRAWLIVLSGVLIAALALAVSVFMVTPKYSSSVKLYVNNNATSAGTIVSASQISAAQSLVKTYGEILDSRTTLERIASGTDLPYTWRQLSEMIRYESSNGTEIMKVTVTADDPYEAALIANAIAEVLPARLGEVIDGASMRVAESAVPELDRVSPSTAKYTVLGFVVGAALCALALFLLAAADDTVYNEDYIADNYDCPILGKIPDMSDTTDKGRRGYFSADKGGEKGSEQA